MGRVLEWEEPMQCVALLYSRERKEPRWVKFSFLLTTLSSKKQGGKWHKYNDQPGLVSPQPLGDAMHPRTAEELKLSAKKKMFHNACAKALEAIGIEVPEGANPLVALRKHDTPRWLRLRDQAGLAPAPVVFSYIRNSDGTVSRI